MTYDTSMYVAAGSGGRRNTVSVPPDSPTVGLLCGKRLTRTPSLFPPEKAL